MKKLITILFLAVAFVPRIVIAKGEAAINQRTEVELTEAIANNIVAVEIRGAFVPEKIVESIDQEGLHYGKCMTISIRNNIDRPLTIKMNTGTLLMPYDTDVQVMVVSHDLSLELKEHDGCETNFYAMCTQIHKFRPSADQAFTIGKTANDSLVRLVKYIEQTFNQNMVGQHAVWAITDNANVTELKDYGADSNSLALTRNILNAVNIVTAINPAGKFIARAHKPGHGYGLTGRNILSVAMLAFVLLFLVFAGREQDSELHRQIVLKTKLATTR